MVRTRLRRLSVGAVTMGTFALLVGFPGGFDAANPPAHAPSTGDSTLMAAVQGPGLELQASPDARRKSVLFEPRGRPAKRGPARAPQPEPESETDPGEQSRSNPVERTPTSPRSARSSRVPVPVSAMDRDHARRRDKVQSFADNQSISRGKPIEDEFGRTVGFVRYRSEIATDLPLRLSAIVDPDDGPAFAAIRNEVTGLGRRLPGGNPGFPRRLGGTGGVWRGALAGPAALRVPVSDLREALERGEIQLQMELEGQEQGQEQGQAQAQVGHGSRFRPGLNVVSGTSDASVPTWAPWCPALCFPGSAGVARPRGA